MPVVSEPAVEARSTLTPVYCHIDILCARALPAADDDNLADPCYELRVEDQTFKLGEPAVRTLNPTFLHRLVLGPVPLPADTENGVLPGPKVFSHIQIYVKK